MIHKHEREALRLDPYAWPFLEERADTLGLSHYFDGPELTVYWHQLGSTWIVENECGEEIECATLTDALSVVKEIEEVQS